MNELKKRKDIENKIDTDKRDVDRETTRADLVVQDAGHVDLADQKIELKGTEEGAKDVIKGVSDALSKTKKTHEKLDKELDKKFGEMKKVEKDLSNRSDGMKNDASAIKNELRAMKSQDTKDAQSEMEKAATASLDDSKFLKDSGNKEKNTRTAGVEEMKKQKATISKFKTRRG